MTKDSETPAGAEAEENARRLAELTRKLDELHKDAGLDEPRPGDQGGWGVV